MEDFTGYGNNKKKEEVHVGAKIKALIDKERQVNQNISIMSIAEKYDIDRSYLYKVFEQKEPSPKHVALFSIELNTDLISLLKDKKKQQKAIAYYEVMSGRKYETKEELGMHVADLLPQYIRAGKSQNVDLKRCMNDREELLSEVKKLNFELLNAKQELINVQQEFLNYVRSGARS